MITEDFPLRLIGPTALAKRLGVSTMSIWGWERDGVLPPRIQLGAYTLPKWRLADIEARLAERGSVHHRLAGETAMTSDKSAKGKSR